MVLPSSIYPEEKPKSAGVPRCLGGAETCAIGFLMVYNRPAIFVHTIAKPKPNTRMVKNLSREEFLRNLGDSGLFSPEEARHLLDALPNPLEPDVRGASCRGLKTTEQRTLADRKRARDAPHVQRR